MNVVIFNLVLFPVCLFALWRGGAPERIAASLFLGAAAITYLIPYDPFHAFRTIETAFLLIDLAMLVALAALALIANRFWPLWVAATQLITTFVHLVKAYEPMMLREMYYGAGAKLAYPMIVLLAVGTWRHRKRLAAWGSDVAWSWNARRDRVSETTLDSR